MNCICCGSTNIYRRGEKLGYSIYKCKSCKFEFVFPLPTIAELEHVYNTGMNKGIAERLKKNIEDLEIKKNYPHRDWFIKIIKKVEKISGKNKLKILEIGSSMGSFVHIANKMGHDAIGTEVSAETANASKGIIQGQIIYTGNARYDELFPINSFDFIYMEHVLEHLINPSEVIAQLSKLLKKDGVLIISVPNQKSWMADIYGLHWDWISPPLHLQYFNKNNLNKLLQKYNLKTITCWTDEYYFRSVYQFFIFSIFNYRIKQVFNKLLKTKFKTEYHFKYLYTYPRSVKEIINLLPYYILYPFIKFFSFIGKGNDLTMIIQK